MLTVDLFTLLATIGVTNGVFFAGYFWFRKESTVNQKILSLLLLTTSLRIVKNIIVHMTIIDPDFEISKDLWAFTINFGISQQFAIGPFFLFYFQSYLDKSFSLKASYKKHLVIYFLFLPASFFINWPFWKYGGLWFSYLHVLFYYLLTFRLYYISTLKGSIDSTILSWLKKLVIFAGLVIVAYSPSLFKYLGYIGGAVLYGLGVYVVIFTIFKEKKLMVKRRYQNSSIPDEEKEKLIRDLEHLMKSEYIYRDPKLKISSIAESLDVTVNKVSRIINENFGKSFNDYINSYRVEEVKERLCENRNKETISSIAYDVGFESISSFNTAFRNMTSMSPTEFRSRYQKRNKSI